MFFKFPWGGVSKSERSWAADQQKQTYSTVIYAKRKTKGEIERLTSHVAALPKSPLPRLHAQPNWCPAPAVHTNNRFRNRGWTLLPSPIPRIAR